MATDAQAKEQVKLDILEDFSPQDIPDLVSFWNFTDTGSSFTADQGEDYILESQSGALEIVTDAQALAG
ncbi:MAG: hypothetical protein HRU15_16300, partial [Planctomycetes bacterium]|nr:hypothetical protein [Planctomycetota bacterium]